MPIIANIFKQRGSIQIAERCAITGRGVGKSSIERPFFHAYTIHNNYHPFPSLSQCAALSHSLLFFPPSMQSGSNVKFVCYIEATCSGS